MSHEVIIHGYISLPGVNQSGGEFAIKQAIESIRSLNDMQHPVLTPAMFNINEGKFEKPWGYDFSIIAFGACYKNLYEVWDLWVEKYESLLKEFFWLESKVYYNGFGGDFVAEWNATHKVIGEFMEKNIIPKMEWENNAFPRKLPDMF